MLKRALPPPPLSTAPSWVIESPPSRTLGCEVVVIGSGAGGAVAARELAERGREVIVVEEGGWVGDLTRPQHEVLRDAYRDGGATPVLGFPGTPPIVLAEGRCVGGSTVVNGGTSWRTPPAALAKWRAQFGLDELTDEEMAPFFDRVERELEVGPVTPEIAGRHNLIAAEATRALGWSGGWVRRNAAGCRGSGRCPFGCPRNAKKAMHVSYLPRAAQHGARVFSRLRAMRILEYGGRATGVLCHTENGEPVEIRARAVVLAAGAVWSSILLRRSKLDVGGNAGRHFVIHPVVKAVGLTDERVEGWNGVVQGWYVDEFARDGILIMTGMVPPELLAFSLPSPRHYEVMARFPTALVVGAIVSDSSRGRVFDGPMGQPLITYRQNRDDARRVKLACEHMTRLLRTAGAREVLCDPTELLTIHPMGTLRMGRDPRTSVTDARGRVHGVRGLYVADASLLPSSIGVNPQITISALATRNAIHLDEDLR